MLSFSPTSAISFQVSKPGPQYMVLRAIGRSCSIFTFRLGHCNDPVDYTECGQPVYTVIALTFRLLGH